MKENWITLKHAAEQIGVSDITVKKWVNEGLLSCRKMNTCFRVEESELQRIAEDKIELCEAWNSVDELLKEYKEEKEKYTKEIEKLRPRKEELKSLILDKKKADCHYDWMMNAMAGFLRGVIYSMTENDERNAMPRQISDIFLKLASGMTIDEIASHYDVSTDNIRNKITKGMTLTFEFCNKLYDNHYISDLHSSICELQDNLDAKNMAIESLKKRIDHIEQSESNAGNEDTNCIDVHSLLDMRLVDCNLSVRILNSMKCAEIDTIRDLVTHKEKEILKIHLIGKTMLRELKDLLENLGLRFGMSSEEIEEYENSGKYYKSDYTEDYVKVARMKLTDAIPELKDYNYLYMSGYRTVLDMLRTRDSHTFKHIAGIGNKDMCAVILFMHKNNLNFGTRIKTSDFNKFFAEKGM